MVRRNQEKTTIEDILEHRALLEKNTVYVFRITQLNWYESLVCSDFWMTTVKNRLSILNSYFIARVNPESVGFKKKGRYGDVVFNWQIDFLPHLLASYFEKNEVDIFTQKLTEQRERGLWDETKDDNQFYEQILYELEKGEAYFRRKVELRSSFKDDQDLPEFKKKELKRVGADEFLKEGLHEIVSFIALYFPQLSWDEYERLVRFFIAEETVTVEEERTVVEDDKTKTWTEKHERSMEEEWLRNGDKVFGECKLILMPDDKNKLFVNFEEPYVREKTSQYFVKKPIFISRQFRAIYERGFLFDWTLSEKLVESVIQFYVLKAVENQTKLEATWLNLQLYSGLENIYKVTLGVAGGNKAEVYKFIYDKLSQKLYERLSLILREILKYEDHQETVYKFLEGLCSEELFDGEEFRTVLSVSVLLSLSPEFDFLRIIRRLLDISIVSNRAYYQLLLYTDRNAHNITQILDVLDGWMPEEGKEIELNSQRTAIKLALDFSFATSKSFPKTYYGFWPSSYSLFDNFLSFEVGFDSAKCERFMESLFSERLRDIGFFYTREIKKKREDGSYDILKYKINVEVSDLQSDILMKWYRIVFDQPSELDSINEKYKSEKEEFFDNVLICVYNSIDRSTRKKIQARWKRWVEVYDQMRINTSDKKVREQHKHLRRSVKSLKANFRQASKNAA